jgi:hypothetical protein
MENIRFQLKGERWVGVRWKRRGQNRFTSLSPCEEWLLSCLFSLKSLLNSFSGKKKKCKRNYELLRKITFFKVK